MLPIYFTLKLNNTISFCSRTVLTMTINSNATTDRFFLVVNFVNNPTAFADGEMSILSVSRRIKDSQYAVNIMTVDRCGQQGSMVGA